MAGGIISLIAGVLGVIAAMMTLYVGAAAMPLFLGGAADTVAGWSGLLFSFLVIIFGAVAISAKSKTPGMLLLIFSVLGIVLGGVFVAILMLLALVGGILTIIATGLEARKG